MFALKLFGGASIDGPGGRLAGPASQRHRLALLALLATSPARPAPRQKLMAYLWPERDAGHAGNLLNQCVYILRRALGDGVIVSTADTLAMDGCLLEADVRAFEEARATDRLEEAAASYVGPFLDGFFLPASPDFEEWAAGERERFRRSYLSVLAGLGERAEAAREPVAALAWWRRLADEEPHTARTVIRLMHALEQSGDRAAALRLARAHTTLVLEEFQAGPHPDVARLVERMRRAPSGSEDDG